MRTKDFLARLEGVKPSGNGRFMALCPAHNDKNPSLSITEGDDKILIKCHTGCDWESILKAMGLKPGDLFLDGVQSSGIGGGITNGQGCNPVTPPPKGVDLATETGNRAVTPPVLPGVTGVTVSALAEAKHLPVDFLKSFGISDCKYNGQPAVRIPYYSENGQELAVRFRLALSGDSRFKWRKGDHAMPYGLNRLDKIRRAGWAVIGEGESDCWTAWYHDIPALGAPGKATWPPAWGEYLKGIDVCVWQEPEAEDFVLRVLKSSPDLRYIRPPNGIKDISEAHIQGHDVPALIEELKVKAESGKALKAQYDNERLSQLYIEAKAIIEAEDPLELVKDAIRGQGYGGDLKPALITYLAATSRLLEMRDGSMPVHLLLTGLSSSGKSYTMTMIKRLLPEEAYHTVDAGSPRTIIYDDADLQHRVLIFGEADSLPAGEDNPAASAVRNLLQDHRLNYQVTVKDADTGDYTVRRVDKPGPTVLITTSTRSLGQQLMTRLFTLEISDSKEQVSAALETQAALEIEGSKPLDDALLAYQHYLQLQSPIKVIVPFAQDLAKAMGKVAAAPRILRDFARLMSLIKSVAILCHHWRLTDDAGRLVATLADYETIRGLVNDIYIDSSMGVTAEVKALVEAVKAINATRAEGEKVTNTKLADRLGISKVAAFRRARRALKEEWIFNRESRKGYPADFGIGEPMPETEGLPDLNTVTQRLHPP